MKAVSVRFAGDLAAALDAVHRAVEAWDGEWQGSAPDGTLWLPVSAGIRRGWAGSALEVEETADGVRLRLEPREVRLHVQRGAAGVLAFGALGGIVAALWPFYPPLLELAPIGAILAVVAWLLVAGRLRSRGLEEFLALVVELGIGDREGSAADV